MRKREGCYSDEALQKHRPRSHGHARLCRHFTSADDLRLLQLLMLQVDPKFLRNQRYAKHGSEKAVREARATAKASA